MKNRAWSRLNATACGDRRKSPFCRIPTIAGFLLLLAFVCFPPEVRADVFVAPRILQATERVTAQKDASIQVLDSAEFLGGPKVQRIVRTLDLSLTRDYLRPKTKILYAFLDGGAIQHAVEDKNGATRLIFTLPETARASGKKMTLSFLYEIKDQVRLASSGKEDCLVLRYPANAWSLPWLSMSVAGEMPGREPLVAACEKNRPGRHVEKYKTPILITPSQGGEQVTFCWKAGFVTHYQAYGGMVGLLAAIALMLLALLFDTVVWKIMWANPSRPSLDKKGFPLWEPMLSVSRFLYSGQVDGYSVTAILVEMAERGIIQVRRFTPGFILTLRRRNPRVKNKEEALLVESFFQTGREVRLYASGQPCWSRLRDSLLELCLTTEKTALLTGMTEQVISSVLWASGPTAFLFLGGRSIPFSLFRELLAGFAGVGLAVGMLGLIKASDIWHDKRQRNAIATGGLSLALLCAIVILSEWIPGAPAPSALALLLFPSALMNLLFAAPFKGVSNRRWLLRDRLDGYRKWMLAKPPADGDRGPIPWALALGTYSGGQRDTGNNKTAPAWYGGTVLWNGNTLVDLAETIGRAMD